MRSYLSCHVIALLLVCASVLFLQTKLLPEKRSNEEELHEVKKSMSLSRTGVEKGADDIEDRKEQSDLLPSTKNKHAQEGQQLQTNLEPSDLIFTQGRWSNPIVIQKYKLVFFTMEKVACTEWKLLFRRMLEYPTWEPTRDYEELHNPEYNGLTYLTDFTLEEAQEMLTSDEWTRAIFTREPKERVLSAFMDKFVNRDYFANKCCGENRLDNEKERENCLRRSETMDFSYFLNRTLDCPNEHWTPQADAIDDKWWPYINFVGYLHSASADVERLLRSLSKSHHGKTPISNRRGMTRGSIKTTWDEHGKTGWGKDGTEAFLARDNEAYHKTNAHGRLRDVYTKCDEAFVEKHWAVEWAHDKYHFEKFKLFDGDADLSDCEMY